MALVLPDPIVATGDRVDPAGVQRNFDTISRSLSAIPGDIRRGAGTCTWTAASTSAATVINHGLGVTPVTVLTSTRNVPAEYAVTARDATTFTVVGYVTTGATITNTLTFDWMAMA